MCQQLKTEYCFLCQLSLTGTENNIPFLVAGTQVVNDEVWYWFIATPLVNEHWFRITREAKKFVQQKKKEHKDKKHLVQVWSGHRSSVGWPTNRTSVTRPHLH